MSKSLPDPFERVCQAIYGVLFDQGVSFIHPRRLDSRAAAAALAALGLDERTLATIADERYSDEWVGNVIRAGFFGRVDESVG